MDVVLIGPDGRQHECTSQPLRVRWDREADLFAAVAEGHEDLARDPMADALYVRSLRFLIAADYSIVGFQILEFASFNPEEGDSDPLYTAAFTVPQMGLVDAAVGEIIEVARNGD
jgi:hypothetical protein